MHTRDRTGTKTRSSYYLLSALFVGLLCLTHLLVVVGAHDEGPRHDHFGPDPDGDLPSSSFFVDGDGVGDDIEAIDSSKVEALSGFGEDTTLIDPSSNRGLAGTAKCRNGTLKQVLPDPGFEKTVPLGPLPNPTGIWAVSRSSQDAKVNGVRTTAADTAAYPRRFGNRQILLSIPDTYTRISGGALIRTLLRAANRSNVVYEVSAHIKWVNYHPNQTAVLSFWMIFPPTSDSSGGYVGVDYKIRTSKWTQFAYRFMNPHRAPPPRNGSTGLILSLYKHQSPQNVTVRLDNVRVWEVCALGRPGPGSGVGAELLTAGSFDAAPLGPLREGDPVYDVRYNPNTVATATIVQDENNATNRQLRMVLPAGNTNYDRMGVGQVLNLTLGARYRVSMKFRRNSNATVRAIINCRIQNVDTGVWLGPVDMIPPQDNLWNTYSYLVAIPEPGPHVVNLHLFGHGNYGNELDVTFDDFSCQRVS